MLSHSLTALSVTPLPISVMSLPNMCELSRYMWEGKEGPALSTDQKDLSLRKVRHGNNFAYMNIAQSNPLSQATILEIQMCHFQKITLACCLFS